jgi:hypothetical protein
MFDNLIEFEVADNGIFVQAGLLAIETDEVVIFDVFLWIIRAHGEMPRRCHTVGSRATKRHLLDIVTNSLRHQPLEVLFHLPLEEGRDVGMSKTYVPNSLSKACHRR